MTAATPDMRATRGSDEARPLLLFGATGDLAQRMLLPSLLGLDCDGLLAPHMPIVATARRQTDTDTFRNEARRALERFSHPALCVPARIEAFLSRLSYVAADVTKRGDFARLREALGPIADKAAIVLSTPPDIFEATILGLHQAGLTGADTRLALEKPLGHDGASSRTINEAVAALFPEERIFRIDHYLGKETVQNLLALRFGNVLLEPMWNAAGIDHIQITVAETVGFEGRVGFYDGAGALRDMVQSHMLQLLALVAMEPPSRFTPSAVRDEKVKVLRSLRRMERKDALTDSVIGQYGPGAIAGVPVRGYSDELGRPSATETFVALKAQVDNWRWRGVPFFLRTGKRLPMRRSEIVIQFRPVAHNIFQFHSGSEQANTLHILLQPEENIRLLVMTKQPGLDRAGTRLRRVALDLGTDSAFAEGRRRIAYERLLLDLLKGETTLFVRRDEVEAQWEWIDGIREAWRENDMVPRPYAAGTWGPAAAIALAERNGVSWHE